VQKQVRVVAIHDTTGNISSLIAAPADARRVGVQLEPWQYMHEVEVPGLGLDADDAQIHARLNEVIESFRVEVNTEGADVPEAQLARKSSTQAY
jgi:hypothetical protein